MSADKKIDVVTLENGVFAVFTGVSLFFEGGESIMYIILLA